MAMARLYGRSPRGQRLAVPVPPGHWMTATFVAALRHDEITRALRIRWADEWSNLLGLWRAFSHPGLAL